MFKKLICLVVIVLLIQSTLKAQVLSPQVTCVSVLPNGDITLTWKPSSDPLNQFVSYQIYTSATLGGPYTLVPGATINVLSQSSYTVVCGCGNTAGVYFYVQATYNAGAGAVTSAPLDTVRTIFLNVVAGAGIANLSWNQPITPPLASSSGIYNVFMEYPIGVWTLVGTTPNQSFIDTIMVCNRQNHTINFRIEIADNTGCTSVSSVAGAILHNTVVPSTPILDTLSVNNTNNAMMNWNTSSSPDCAGYVIYKFSGGVWVTVDTAFGINNTSYTYPASVAGTASELYRVAGFDSCGNISPAGNSLATIYLTTTPDICNHSAILNWTAYPNIGTGLAGYRIYQSAGTAAGPYVYLGNTAAGILTYTATGLTTLTTYYFKVEAYDVSGAKLASSNRRSFFCGAPIPPQYLKLLSASVVSSSQIDVNFVVDTAASVLGYKIFRSTSNISTSYQQVGFVPGSLSRLNLFSDYTVDADHNAYYYKIVNIDSCGFNGMTSNIGRTMLLTAVGNSDFTNTISWNKYRQWGTTSTSPVLCDIFRGTFGIFSTIPIATISMSADDTTYIDNVFNVVQGEGSFIYRIEAQGSYDGYATNSFSNTATAKQAPEFYIPNAFTPTGLNPVFKPVFVWVNYASYEFDIFDRFGELIFSTKNEEGGWDGKRQGSLCQMGVYAYRIHYRASDGKEYNWNGMVTLLR